MVCNIKISTVTWPMRHIYTHTTGTKNNDQLQICCRQEALRWLRDFRKANFTRKKYYNSKEESCGKKPVYQEKLEQKHDCFSLVFKIKNITGVSRKNIFPHRQERIQHTISISMDLQKKMHQHHGQVGMILLQWLILNANRRTVPILLKTKAFAT